MLKFDLNKEASNGSTYILQSNILNSVRPEPRRWVNGIGMLTKWVIVWKPLMLRPLRDRSRVVPRSDSACVFTKRERSENAGFTKSRRVIGEHVSHPLVGWRTSDQDGWGLRSNLICRGIFEDFHAGSKGNLYSKIATPRSTYPSALQLSLLAYVSRCLLNKTY